jgi:hypothetical protein
MHGEGEEDPRAEMRRVGADPPRGQCAEMRRGGADPQSRCIEIRGVGHRDAHAGGGPGGGDSRRGASGHHKRVVPMEPDGGGA